MTNKKNATDTLGVQLRGAQELIMEMYEHHGVEEATQMVNELLSELEPHHANILRTLVTAMQSEAMGDAGTIVH